MNGFAEIDRIEPGPDVNPIFRIQTRRSAAHRFQWNTRTECDKTEFVTQYMFAVYVYKGVIVIRRKQS
jgi:hypothetical protein